MSHKRRILIAAVLLLGSDAYSGDVAVRTNTGQKTGEISKNGMIRNNTGQLKGSITADGTIRDQYGSIKGRMLKGGSVVDDYGKKIGSISSSREVRDEQGRLLGRIKGRDAYNARGQKMGTAPFDDPAKIAVYFFFFPEIKGF